MLGFIIQFSFFQFLHDFFFSWLSSELPCDVLWTLLDQFPWLLSEASPSKITGPIKVIHASPRQSTIPFSKLPVTSLHPTARPAAGVQGSCGLPASPLWSLHTDIL